MAQIQSNKCKTCEKDNASYFCYECQYYLCEPCKLLHDKFLKKHTVTESYKIDKSVFASILKCGRHDLEFAHYCKDCKCLTCSECTTSGHKSHEFTNVSEVAASIRTDLNEANCKAKAKLEILSRLIEEIQNVKMKKVKAENDQFVKEARKIERELIRIIETVTEQNVNRASDFLVLEQQNLNSEIANLKKLQMNCRSVTETIEQVMKIKHDMTFYVQHESLTKDKVETDSIPTIKDTNKIEDFKAEEFIGQVIESIQSKYSIRLSWFASKQLTEGNPNFTDLSDKNRPTKIVENFHVVYDEEWTNALEVLSSPRKGNMKEDEAIHKLMNLVKEIYNFCCSTATDQTLNIAMNILKPYAIDTQPGGKDDGKVFRPGLEPKIKLLRREYCMEPIANITEKFKRTSEDFKIMQKYPEVVKYIEKCTEIFWLMRTIDPPMVLKWPEGGEVLNVTLYNHYNKKGDKVSYAVWPAVLLHEGGAVMYKGFAKPQ